MKKEEKLVLGILDKMEVEYSKDITPKRAKKKLERALDKGVTPKEALDEKEKKILDKMGFKVESEEVEEEEVEETEEEEEEEKEVKKDKGKKKGKGKKEKKEEKPAKKEKKEKTLSNIDMMKKLIKGKASDKEITKEFTSRYKAKGQDDKDFIQKRIKIYKRLAGG